MENPNFFPNLGDMADSSDLLRSMQQVRPDEVCNLAAHSHVAVSFEEPEYTVDSDVITALHLLEGAGVLRPEKKPRFHQPSSLDRS